MASSFDSTDILSLEKPPQLVLSHGVGATFNPFNEKQQ